MAETPPCAVKRVETVTAGADVPVRRSTLAPGEAVPWHRHTATDDLCVPFSGALRVEPRGPRRAHVLAPGGCHRTPAGRAHRLSNAGASDCAFRLVRGVGRRDFVPEDAGGG